MTPRAARYRRCFAETVRRPLHTCCRGRLPSLGRSLLGGFARPLRLLVLSGRSARPRRACGRQSALFRRVQHLNRGAGRCACRRFVLDGSRIGRNLRLENVCRRCAVDLLTPCPVGHARQDKFLLDTGKRDSHSASDSERSAAKVSDEVPDCFFVQRFGGRRCRWRRRRFLDGVSASSVYLSRGWPRSWSMTATQVP